ncbi:hypothetical protein LRAMOSA01991 [Lichtheimia ramosa]|uniref:Defective in cullin neddylation protein n=1 Tax=Lichtheimia ramosa TaxID=688394 RepID=A0A077WMV3_9FUNG|nr:hypothetical protein LRAMOSA01991 [Lichtheimia ramosa]
MAASQVKGTQLEKVKRLKEFTNITDREAIQRLKSSNWDVNVALNAYYDSTPRSQPNSTNCNVSEIESTFDKYRDQDEKDKISIEGAMALCQDLGIEPTQFEFLVMSYQLGSERMGEFHRKAFVQGMVRLQCNTITELREELPQLMKLLDDPEQFRAIYNYAFILGREQGQKSLSLEAAIELWRLLLNNRFTMLEDWITFLEEKHGKAISKDTWTLFLDFASQPNIDLDAHDLMGAWPILIDEFVEYMQEKQ